MFAMKTTESVRLRRFKYKAPPASPALHEEKTERVSVMFTPTSSLVLIAIPPPDKDSAIALNTSTLSMVILESDKADCAWIMMAPPLAMLRKLLLRSCKSSPLAVDPLARKKIAPPATVAVVFSKAESSMRTVVFDMADRSVMWIAPLRPDEENCRNVQLDTTNRQSMVQVDSNMIAGAGGAAERLLFADVFETNKMWRAVNCELRTSNALLSAGTETTTLPEAAPNKRIVDVITIGTTDRW